MAALKPGDVVIVPVPTYRRGAGYVHQRVGEEMMLGKVVRRGDLRMTDALGRYIVEVPDALCGRVLASLGEMHWFKELQR